MATKKKKRGTPPAKRDNRVLRFPCVTARQGDLTLALFAAPAKQLWQVVEVNRRDPDKEKGYQRALSQSRVEAIGRYIRGGNPIPTSLLVSLEGATLSQDGAQISIPNRHDSGWVIDGQHRLIGAHQTDIDVTVVAFLDLPLEKQVEQFVTINREAKGVPTSLYYDLLKELPRLKTEPEQAKERAASLADTMNRDGQSPFHNRIVIVTAPRRGELSLTNFVRKIERMVHPSKGKFNLYTELEQRGIFDNYYRALANVFPEVYRQPDTVFFQTVGFGALMNALPTVFDLAMLHYKGFRIEDAVRVLKAADFFNFDDWKQMGTGNAAENQAGEDFRQELLNALKPKGDDETSSLRLT